jgi:hypothetical protein
VDVAQNTRQQTYIPAYAVLPFSPPMGRLEK